jgi:release factor glutamine methyltransferase
MSDSVLNFEPHHALFANDQGMFFYKQIELESPEYLLPNGKLMFEINPLQEEYFKNKKYTNFKDINGKTRFSVLK